MPHLRELQSRYKGQGLALIGIHSDKDAKAMKETVKKNSITWPIAQDNSGKTTEAFATNAFPTYALIDRKGKVRVMDIEPEDLEKAIKLLLKEKP